MQLSREWRRQLIAIGILVAGLAPVAWLDASLLGGQHGSDWISLDMRGLFIWVYVIWVGIQTAITSAIVAWGKVKNVLAIHMGVVVFVAFAVFAAFLVVS